MDRLHRSCRRLIWLNPLLRFDGFEAKARGIRAMLPHVDEFRPIHNLEAMPISARRSAKARAARPRRWLAAREAGAWRRGIAVIFDRTDEVRGRIFQE
jgi:uncharacterized protein